MLMANRTNRVSSEVASEYLRKYGDIPSLRLARVLHKDHPALFPKIETARDVIRMLRGKRGAQSRRDGKLITDFLETKVRSTNSHQIPTLPKSHAEPWEPFVIHGAQRILVLSDIHMPFHDEIALEAALKRGEAADPTIVLLNGDIIDGYEQSRFEKDPRKRTAASELQMLKDLFIHLRARFPTARIIFKEGNHDERWEKYLMRCAPILFGMPEFNLYAMADMAAHGVEHVGEKRKIIAGKLTILHGHELHGGGGVNPARALYLKTGGHALIGHFHRTSEHFEKQLDNAVVGAWSVGCLCDMSPEYSRINKWNHGAAIVETRADGTFVVDSFRIIDGVIF